MQNILDYLVRDAAAYPDKIAFSDENISYTYKQLLEASCSAGAFINGLQNSAPAPVGVIARHDTATILAFFGILCSGNYYVPIDPKAPEEKILKITSDSALQIILGRAEDKELIPASFTGQFFIIQDIPEQTTGTFTPAASAEDPLYMIYTSGSTGMPKGVLKTHGAVMDFIETYARTFEFSADEIIGSQTPFFFDASAKDIYLTLKLAATMEIIPEGMFTLPPSLIRFLNEKKISFISWVPSALCVVTQLNTFEVIVPETLKKIFFVGESFPLKHFKKWQETLPDVEYVNLYGATELAGICCFYRVPEDISGLDRLPIGKPLDNCQILLVENTADEKASDDAAEKASKDAADDGCENTSTPASYHMAEVPVITSFHKTGEIWLASDALFREYFHDPVKTATSTVLIDGIRYFKTGDLAWYDENGDLNFAARNDSQIKHMGQRIELGEIEAVCNTLPSIQKACCLYNMERKRIYLFCELTEGVQEDQKSLLIQLKQKLVSYMMPQRVVIKDRLPLNANGKIDRQSLKEEMK